MIGDISRTGTYRKAILGNAAVAFRDKVVLDLGAGELYLSASQPSLIGRHRKEYEGGPLCQVGMLIGRVRDPVIHVCSGRGEGGDCLGSIYHGEQNSHRESTHSLYADRKVHLPIFAQERLGLVWQS